MMIKFFNKLANRLKSQVGQGIVEYGILLMIAAVSFAVIEEVREATFNKTGKAIETLENDVGKIPEGIPFEVPELRISPPIAHYIAPTPVYKGLEVFFKDSSYDTDEDQGGYVEHWVWVIKGKDTNETHKFSKKQMEDKKGLLTKFRYSGVYEVTLYVYDNDGLVSQPYTEQIVVENRPPTIILEGDGGEGRRTGEITICRYEKVKIYTEIDDPDLPYDELTLKSVFLDHSGEKHERDTAPSYFEREFPNLGKSTYTVTVTDEDGASITETLTINVIETGCAAETKVKDPIYKIVVHGYGGAKLENGETNPTTSPLGTKHYLFTIGETARLEAVVDWLDGAPHRLPYYWEDADQFSQGRWVDKSSQNLFLPSYVYSQNSARAFTFDDVGMIWIVTGQARNTNAVDDVKDCETLFDGKSNCDTVSLEVLNPSNISQVQAIISPDIHADTPVKSTTGAMVTGLTNSFNSYDTASGKSIPNMEVQHGTKMRMASEKSYAFKDIDHFGSEKEALAAGIIIKNRVKLSDAFLREFPETDIVGVHWTIDGMEKPNSSSGPPSYNYQVIPKPVMEGDEGGMGNSSHINYIFKGKVYAPDISKQGDYRVYNAEKTEGGLYKDKTYTYKLFVFNGLGASSNTTKIITAKLLNAKPKAMCSPKEVTANIGGYPLMNAADSTDPEKDTLQAFWATKSKTQKVGPFKITDNVPKLEQFTSKNEGKMTLILQVVDSKGNKSDDVECIVNFKPTVSGSNFYVEHWEIENRVTIANAQTRLFNMTNTDPDSMGSKDGYMISKIYMSGLIVAKVNPSSNNAETSHKKENTKTGNGGNTAAESPHVGRLNSYEAFPSGAGVYRIYAIASDSGGIKDQKQCTNGTISSDPTTAIYHKIPQKYHGLTYCKKPVFIFRFAALDGQRNLVNEPTRTAAAEVTERNSNRYNKVCMLADRSVTSGSQYISDFGYAGSKDVHGEYSVSVNLKAATSKCSSIF